MKTPSGHGMEKKDYPFDDNGSYRKDWVKNKATGKVRSASKIEETTLASTDSVSSSSASTSGSYYGPADVGSVSSSETTQIVAAAPVASAPSAADYHKVVSGDTLYSLSQRYGTSVNELKRVNGLTSDSIRTGQSLRVP
ncbi:MAG: LysM peptidoglycan-binding domain-containing protein [Verrucomicrobiales bacterium]|nr:LysM peptidoglycan-binding domain-containing protein [Verrucomicrobiales bacterium]